MGRAAGVAPSKAPSKTPQARLGLARVTGGPWRTRSVPATRRLAPSRVSAPPARRRPPSRRAAQASSRHRQREGPGWRAHRAANAPAIRARWAPRNHRSAPARWGRARHAMQCRGLPPPAVAPSTIQFRMPSIHLRTAIRANSRATRSLSIHDHRDTHVGSTSSWGRPQPPHCPPDLAMANHSCPPKRRPNAHAPHPLLSIPHNTSSFPTPPPHSQHVVLGSRVPTVMWAAHCAACVPCATAVALLERAKYRHEKAWALIT